MSSPKKTKRKLLDASNKLLDASRIKGVGVVKYREGENLFGTSTTVSQNFSPASEKILSELFLNGSKRKNSAGQYVYVPPGTITSDAFDILIQDTRNNLSELSRRFLKYLSGEYLSGKRNQKSSLIGQFSKLNVSKPL